MNDAIITIGAAGDADIDGILALQDANQMANGGTLSARLPRDRILAMKQAMPLIVARRANEVVGFLMTTTRAMNADIPIVQAMFDAYPGTDDA